MSLFSGPQRPSTSTTTPNPHISEYAHLWNLPRADEALKLLHQIASSVKPIMRKYNWTVGTLAEFLPDNPRLQGLNTNAGEIINIRLRPASNPHTFLDTATLMDTILHELTHNIHGDHDERFYALFEEIKGDWRMLSARGYKGEGFFSQGHRLGSGHVFYRPRGLLGEFERRRVRDAVERRERGVVVGLNGLNGGRLLGVDQSGEMDELTAGVGGRRLGGTDLVRELTARELAAIAAEQRANDQRRCGAKYLKNDMKKERDKAARESTRTMAKDLPVIHDLGNYELEDQVTLLSVPTRPSLSSTDSSWNEGYRLGEDWHCRQCTFRNPPLFLSCQMCQAERGIHGDEGDLIDLTSEYQVSWDCGTCTFRNENVLDGKCIVCGTAA